MTVYEVLNKNDSMNAMPSLRNNNNLYCSQRPLWTLWTVSVCSDSSSYFTISLVNNFPFLSQSQLYSHFPMQCM